MAVKNDINVPLIFTIGVTSVLLLAVILLGTRAWFTYEFDVLTAEKNAAHVPEELVALKDQQLGHLKGGEWVNDGRGNHAAVTIPIRQAMDLFAKAKGHPTTLPAREPLVKEEKSTTAPASQPAGKGVDGVPNAAPLPSS